MMAEQFLGENKSVAIREHHVQKDQIRPFGLQSLPDTGQISESGNLMVGKLQVTGNRLPDGFVVFHHVYMCHSLIIM